MNIDSVFKRMSTVFGQKLRKHMLSIQAKTGVKKVLSVHGTEYLTKKVYYSGLSKGYEMGLRDASKQNKGE